MSPTTPERDQRVLESPEYHRTPHNVRIARLGASIPPVPPPVFMPPPNAPQPAPVYSHLPEELARQYAALPPLHPRRQSSVQPVPAPAFAPAPVTAYRNLPPHLAQQLAALPPLIQPGRGRGRGRGRGNNTVAPAPLPFAEIAAQYAALQPVSVIYCCIWIFLNII